MLKRVYYPINKTKIQEAIDLYFEYCAREPHISYKESMLLWDKYCDAFNEICPGSNVWASNFFQPMNWSNTLTVENVYYAILAMGINTKMEEVDYE